MAKLLMMRGLPASGKTTRAKEIMKSAGNNLIRVNRDQLRPMLHGDTKWSGKKEKVTRYVQKSIVSDMLSNNYSVIVDDTNLRDADRERWSQVAHTYNAKFEIVDMDTPYEHCINRDDARMDAVGAHVITSMALSSGRFPYNNIILCDIDGTIADLTHRLHYVNNGNRDWDSFFASVGDDKFRESIWRQVIEDAEANDAVVIFLSGRSDITRNDTEEWLESYVEFKPLVLMRREFDRRPDTDVKRDIYDWHFRDYNIVRIYDDRPRLVKMWREKGLDCVDCGDGVEF